MQGRIHKALSGFYYTKTDEGTYMCRARGRFKKRGFSPLVGDIVEIVSTPSTIPGELEGRIEDILPRQNEFIRPPVANIDLFLVVIAAREPSLNLEILDRFLVMSEAKNVSAIIVISKLDLLDSTGERQDLIKRLTDIYGKYYEICYMQRQASQVDTMPIEALLAGRKGEIVALAGPSGVGKTSIVKALLEGIKTDEPEMNDIIDFRYASGESLKTASISRKLNKGKSTTRHVELYRLNSGAMLVDTPGFAAFETIEIASCDITKYFPEFGNNCKYANCRHINEPDCRVKDRVANGEIARSRYDSYVKIYNEQVKKEETYL